MRLRVVYRAQFRTAAGCGEEMLDLPAEATDLAELLPYLVTLHKELSPLLLAPDGTPRRSAMILLNDQMATKDEPFHDGDCVTFLSPMAGG